MDLTDRRNLLFIINPKSGNQSINWEREIRFYFKNLDYSIEIHTIKGNCNPEEIRTKIESCNPNHVVAVGGDGTVALVAECLLHQNIPLGILPAGSANGMAKELGISEKPSESLSLLTNGRIKTIHVTMINNKLCLHLSDIGFNARMIEKFQSENIRGFWGYFRSTVQVSRNIFFSNKMRVSMRLDHETIDLKAAMIVIANATKYGSGAVINPAGNLEDEWFEVIVVKKISLIEVFKMLVSHSSFNSNKMAVYKTKSLQMKLPKKNHFQVDGEYLGKVSEVEAQIIPAAIKVIVPSRK